MFNQKGISAVKAFDQVKKLLGKDGDPYFDLGSYTTVEMPKEADELIKGALKKNLINKNEFEATTLIHDYLVKAIGEMLHVPEGIGYGAATVGSSEAAFLALLGARSKKKAFQKRDVANIVLCSNAHMCWHKAADFLGVEVREVRLENVEAYPMEEVLRQVDEHTLWVVATQGCTNLGLCDPVYLLNRSLEQLNEKHHWDVGIHVDAAIGGFIFPFTESVHPLWDFRLPLIRSINLSGHKYGLVYPGIGWVIFRDKRCFDESFIRSYDYLLGISESSTVNFSQNACFVIAQYFNFLHHGVEGYQKVIRECFKKARFLSEAINASPYFDVVGKSDIPMVVFRLMTSSDLGLNEKSFCEELRKRSWMLPHYVLPAKIDKRVMRIVIRKDMTWDRLRKLTEDLEQVCIKLLTEKTCFDDQ